MSELATDYAEGALPPGRRLAVRFHLAFCRMCRAYLDQIEKTRHLLAGRTLAVPPPEVEDRLISQMHPGE